MPKPSAKTINQMLDDVQAVTESRFYEDPTPIASPIEMFRMPEGKQGGEAFADLSVREKIQVLGDYTHWHDYEQKGISPEQMDRVFHNVIEGKPRDQWLEGTGLSTRQSLMEIFSEWRQDARAAEAERQQRTRLEKELGPREEVQAKPKQKDRGIER